MINQDAKGSKMTDTLFANAYRATVPLLADPKHVTVRIHPNRFAELQKLAFDMTDAVEIGSFLEGPAGAQRSVTRAIAVPLVVHPQDGVEIVVDPAQDPEVVAFCVNGIPELQITGLALNLEEVAAKKVADDKAAADAKAAHDAEFQTAIDAAYEAGRKQAVLDQAKAEGAASVSKTSAPSGVVQ